MTIQTPEQIPIWRKQDWAYEEIKHRVSHGILAPGVSISIGDLASELGLSRVPIRQALVRLEAEGLVRHEPHRRWQVTSISIDDATDVYLGRQALESALTAKAATRVEASDIVSLREMIDDQKRCLDRNDLEGFRRLDRQFHDTIFEIAHLSRTWQVQQQLRAHADRYLVLYTSARSRAYASVKQHSDIIGALASRDSSLAAEVAGEHVYTGLSHLINQLDPKH